MGYGYIDALLPSRGGHGPSQVQQIDDLLRGRNKPTIMPNHKRWGSIPKFEPNDVVRMTGWPENQTAVVRRQDACGGLYLKGHGSKFYNSLNFTKVE